MKTTIDLPDALADEAKQVARDEGTTLRELVIAGLRAEIRERREGAPRIDVVFPTFQGRGMRVDVTHGRLHELTYEWSQ